MNVELSTILLQSLGWALAHSIWQITVFALILAFLLPRISNTRRRYWVALFSLFTAFIAFIITFLWVAFDKWKALDLAVPNDVVLVFNQNTLAISSANLSQILNTWLEAHVVPVVLFWVAGFGISLLRLFGGMYFMHRLQRIKVGPAPLFWQNKLDTMRGQLRLSRPVTLLESALVQSPITWGYFKPLIFFPVGLLNQLSAIEVESILAHELAHIARRDWLFNLFQAFIEACFYYHPAAWWISSVICAERENCCDDDALQLTGDRFTLAKALLNLQQLRAPNTSPLALNAQGRRKYFHRFSLLSRIQRILNQPTQQKSLIMEKFVATTLLLGVLTLVGIRANNGTGRLEAANKALSETAFACFGNQPDADSALDSVPKPPHRIQKVIREDDGKKVEMDLKDGQVTRLNIDGRDIPANEWAQHQALTGDIIREIADAPPPPPPPPPPAPGMPPAPPMPPMPPSNRMEMQMRAPMPPTAPMPPLEPRRLSTSKDSDGNTLIHLERAGKPMEIAVKNGEVWVDGKRVAEGESLEISEPMEIQQRIIREDRNSYMIHSDNGEHENMIIYRTDSPMPPNGQMEIEMHRKIMDENMQLSEKDQKKQQKAMQKAEKDMRKAEQELKKQQEKMEEQFQKMEAERRSQKGSQ